MFNRETILKKTGKSEDRLLISKLLDKYDFWQKTGKTAFSDFLDPSQQKLAASLLGSPEHGGPVFDGGFAGAERAVAIFGGDFEDDPSSFRDSIFKLVNAKPSSRSELSHRDYLGALMALGIKREKTGDIIVGLEQCDIIVLAELSEFISYNLTKVGNAEVDVKIKGIGEIGAAQPKIKEIKTTVASLRLDCVVAPGFGMSRSKAAEYIKAGKLSLNWEITDRPDKAVRESDMIAIRGKGKLVIEKVGPSTRKDRIVLILRKFI